MKTFTEPWKTCNTKWGPFDYGLMFCGTRHIGWHIQKGCDVLFILGDDITVGERKAYEASLKKGGFRYVVIESKEDALRFSKECPMDPLWHAVVDLAIGCNPLDVLENFKIMHPDNWEGKRVLSLLLCPLAALDFGFLIDPVAWVTSLLW